MGAQVFRNFQRVYPVIARGKGVFLYDQAGREYLDAVVIVVTSDVLKANAAKSEFGGYGAGMRVGVDLGGTKIEAIALDEAGAVLGDICRPGSVPRYSRALADAVAGLTGDRIPVDPDAPTATGRS